MAEETKLTHLGSNKTEYPTSYAPQLLEKFPNKFPESELPNNILKKEYVVELDCPEFTTLCPITAQPDFGKIIIRYYPDKFLVESKSLKLYLFSFRQHGSFHEEVINIIAKDLFQLLEPHWIEVQGYFNPRGGISINPKVVYKK